MALAALIVSVLALLVAAAAALFAKRQSDSTSRLETFEAARRHDELSPQLVARAVPATEHRQWPSLELESRGPHDLDSVTLKLLGPLAGESPVGTLIDSRNGALTDELELGALSVAGRPAVVRIQLEDEDTRGETVRLFVTSTRGKEQWKQHLDCEFPRPTRLIV